MDPLEIFLICPPGLQNMLATEAREKGFVVTSLIPGGVFMKGGWSEVWRANLELRGAVRVLVRLVRFEVTHLAQLDKISRKIAWANWLRAEVPVKVTAVCKGSKIYHERAAAERVARAINEELGAPLGESGVALKVRIERDECVISVDTSGEPLHRRGTKLQVNKAPMRENLAAMFLRSCGYDGTEPVLDPMCGSGTFVLEAAEIAAGFQPGRTREFAFEKLASFDAQIFETLKRPVTTSSHFRGYGSDRDAGAVSMSEANAKRAGLAELVQFSQSEVWDVLPPSGLPGLVIVNPPYGMRIGANRSLKGLYARFGARMSEHFSGWRIGLVTSDRELVRATGLPFGKPGPVIDHGGIKIRLYQTGSLV